MPFNSILFGNEQENTAQINTEEPEFFNDLNLDQVVEKITSPKSEYNLKPYFYSRLTHKETILFRQSIFRDLETPALFELINHFAEKMVIARQYLKNIDKLNYHHHQQGWFLESASVYCDAVSSLAAGLSSMELTSQGLMDFREYINGITKSIEFNELAADAENLKTKLSAVQYSIVIKSNYVRVQRYKGEIEYSSEVEKTFDRFRQGEVKNHKVDLITRAGMDHVEAQILKGVVKLFPEIFKELDQFCLKHNNFIDQLILTFDREIQFYIATIEFASKIKELGLEFCYPRITERKGNIQASNAYDIALANQYFSGDAPIVCNDFAIKNKERIIVVTGPNQGGKTTFARMFGQLHFFACLGCPVSASDANLLLFDQIFTHFEKEEKIQNLRGKLKDDLVRIHRSLQQATSNSLFIINEIFTSTTLQDAAFLGEQILEEIARLDSLCVFVTFLDELSRMGEQTISMMSTVVAENPVERTFKIVRKPADGLSFAICIAEKHNLTYSKIKERINNESKTA